jgi:hypothetical protein
MYASSSFPMLFSDPKDPEGFQPLLSDHRDDFYLPSLFTPGPNRGIPSVVTE